MIGTNPIVRTGARAARAIVVRCGLGPIASRLLRRRAVPLPDLVGNYDVVVMKHCFPASDMVDNWGTPDPSSETKNLENYQAFYRTLRTEFAKYPNTIFVVWTLPPLHRLATTPQKAARAAAFSEWLRTEFLTEGGPHPNIFVWDFRGLVEDPSTGCLRQEYELSHDAADSHPNDAANNEAGPRFAQFLADSITSFCGGIEPGLSRRIVFLHHSTGGNVYNYPEFGVPRWIDQYNREHGTAFEIMDLWYPPEGNMPIDYHRAWLANTEGTGSQGSGE